MVADLSSFGDSWARTLAKGKIVRARGESYQSFGHALSARGFAVEKAASNVSGSRGRLFFRKCVANLDCSSGSQCVAVRKTGAGTAKSRNVPASVGESWQCADYFSGGDEVGDWQHGKVQAGDWGVNDK